MIRSSRRGCSKRRVDIRRILYEMLPSSRRRHNIRNRRTRASLFVFGRLVIDAFPCAILNNDLSAVLWFSRPAILNIAWAAWIRAKPRLITCADRIRCVSSSSPGLTMVAGVLAAAATLWGAVWNRGVLDYICEDRFVFFDGKLISW